MSGPRSAHFRRPALRGLVLAVAAALAVTGSAASPAFAHGGPLAQAVIPGSQVDLQAVLAGPSAADGGDPFTYTVQYSNNSLPDADGATFTWTAPTGATSVAATCTSATGGAACPGTLTVSTSGVSGTIPTLPHLGAVTITITGNYPVGTAAVSSSTTITPPATTTDPDPSTNTSFVNTTLTIDTDLAVTKSASASLVAPGDSVTYTVTYTNSGPSAADGAVVQDYLQLLAGPEFAGTVGVTFTSCVPSGGAVCPTFVDNPAAAGYIWNDAVPTMPGGSSFVVTYVVDFTVGDPSSCYSGTTQARFPNSVDIHTPTGVTEPDYTNNHQDLTLDADVTPCPTGAGTTSKTGSSTLIAPGDTVTYSVTYSNTGAVAEDGAPIRDHMDLRAGPEFASSADVHFLPCTGTGGAVCPTLTDVTIDDLTDIYNTTIPTFPAGSSITITYEVFFTVGDPSACFPGPFAATFYNAARLDPPPFIIDPGSVDDFRSDGDVTPCPDVDVTAEKTADVTSVRPGDVVTYTVTYTNDGPGDASGSAIDDSMNLGAAGAAYGGVDVHFVSCTPTGGAACPTLTDVANSTFVVYSTALPSLPSGSSVVIVYEAEYNASATPACATSAGANVENRARIFPPSTVHVVNTSDDDSLLQIPTNCAEISVNKQVTPTAAQAGDPVSFLATVTNGGISPATDIGFTDPLPSGFLYDSSSCAPSAGSPTCGTVGYDSATRTVTSVIPQLATGEAVVFTIQGFAGVVQGTYPNTASVAPTASSAYWDPNPVTDSSQVNLQVFNTTSTITITKEIAGYGGAGLPAPLTFTGTVTCGTQGTQPWSATVAAGSLSGTSAAVTFFDTEPCTIDEDAVPTAPSGYAWTGAPVISPATIAALGPATPVSVTVTNALVALPPATATLTVTKVVAGLAAGGLAAPATFTGTLHCAPAAGTPTDEPWSVTVPAGQSTATTSAFTELAGATCSVTEDAPPAPPAGYTWSGAPVIAVSPTAPLAASTLTDVTVTNTVAAIPPTGSLQVTIDVTGAPAGGVSGVFSFSVFCGSDGTFTLDIPLAGAVSGSGTVPNIPAGASCTAVESARPPAPAGYVWPAGLVSSAAVSIVASTVSAVGIVNPLQPVTAAVAFTGLAVGPTLRTGIALLAGGMLFVLIARSRRSALLR